MFRVLLVLLLLTTTSAEADVIIDPSQISDLVFEGSLMGQTPDEGMICKSGSCVDGWVEEKNGRKQLDIARYNKPVDITHLGAIEITNPRYEFYNAQFFKVSFYLLCGTQEASACVDSAIETLDELYELSWVRPLRGYSGNSAEGMNRQYVTRARALLETGWSEHDGSGDHPYIKIYDKALIDALRLEANPLYIPREIILDDEDAR